MSENGWLKGKLNAENNPLDISLRAASAPDLVVAVVDNRRRLNKQQVPVAVLRFSDRVRRRVSRRDIE
jgi:hypothetical protein